MDDPAAAASAPVAVAPGATKAAIRPARAAEKMTVAQPKIKPAKPSGNVLRKATSSTYTKPTMRAARTSLATVARRALSEPEKDRDHDGEVSWSMNQLNTLSPLKLSA